MKLVSVRRICILIILISFNTVVSASASSNCPDSLQRDIAKLLVKYHIPGASIVVVRDGKLLCTDTLGNADLATKRPVTVDTLFQACSITKAFTSVAVLQILDKYKISLDAPVNDYLQRWKIPQNRFTAQQPVTIRMLLNHTAAISDPYPDGGYSYNAKLPTLTQVFLGQPPATNPPLQVMRKPGVQYSYCNGCYAVLQMFLEDVTNESYPELMHKQIFIPLKMTDSEFDNQLFLHKSDKVALPYDVNHKRFLQAPITNPIYATGLLWTTPIDLARFIIAVQKSLNNQHGLIAKKIALDMVTPSSTPTRSLGFFISDKNANEHVNGYYFMHSGNNIGYLTLMIGSLDGKNGAVIMINISPEWNAKNYPQFGFIRESLKLIASYYHWQ
ncbi:MAG TPA: serine hydrolase domain-containing protein [Gammaproteobacteria bacterium]|jgi:CubicO group peptidase (beta-lactamase class C family)|nr:serine hydrolase domain-containing protein [Gammaproteobacteria bacterium]